MVSSAVAFSYSKWNADTQDREKVLFQSCETLEDEPLPEVGLLFVNFFASVLGTELPLTLFLCFFLECLTEIEHEIERIQLVNAKIPIICNFDIY